SVSKEKASTFECLAEKTNRPEYYEKGTVRSECFSNLEEKIIENTEREKKENTSEKECIICTEKVIIRDFMKVAEQCDHEDNMCQNCICEYITLELLKKGNINVLCPEYGCHSVLQEPDIKRFASAEAFERYVERIYIIETCEQCWHLVALIRLCNNLLINLQAC
ncbi:4513_t:CDS:1, partial [Entrophospora sp. SA101]